MADTLAHSLPKPDLNIALLHVSKQISAEAAHYFYSLHTFIMLEPCDDYAQDGDDLALNPAHNWYVCPASAREC
jgi:hypothetical protein